MSQRNGSSLNYLLTAKLLFPHFKGNQIIFHDAISTQMKAKQTNEGVLIIITYSYP